jgi:hypothetical protein
MCVFHQNLYGRPEHLFFPEKPKVRSPQHLIWTFGFGSSAAPLALPSPLPVTIIFSPRKKTIRPRQHDHSKLASLLLHGREFNNGPLDSKAYLLPQFGPFFSLEPADRTLPSSEAPRPGSKPDFALNPTTTRRLKSI